MILYILIAINIGLNIYFGVETGDDSFYTQAQIWMCGLVFAVGYPTQI